MPGNFRLLPPDLARYILKSLASKFILLVPATILQSWTSWCHGCPPFTPLNVWSSFPPPQGQLAAHIQVRLTLHRFIHGCWHMHVTRTRADHGPAYTSDLLWRPTWGQLPASQSALRVGSLISTTAAQGIDPIRACLEAKRRQVKISSPIGLQSAFPEATRYLNTHQKL